MIHNADNLPHIVLTVPVAGYPAGTLGFLVEVDHFTDPGRPPYSHYIIEIDGRQLEVGESEFKPAKLTFLHVAVQAYHAAEWSRQANQRAASEISRGVTKTAFEACFGIVYQPQEIGENYVVVDGLRLNRVQGPEYAFTAVKVCRGCRREVVSVPVSSLVELGRIFAATSKPDDWPHNCKEDG